MTKFDMLEKMKQCPLCNRKWHIIEERGKTGKAYFACNWCQIILWVRDVFIGHWDEFEAVPCPVCGHAKMNFFCREDCYCKWHCPKCGADVENKDIDLSQKVIELKKIREGQING